MNAALDETALRAGKAAARYADAIWASVDEPVEGGRLPATALMLADAAQHLTRAHEPGFEGDPAAHPLWVALCAEAKVPTETWGALFDPKARAALGEQAVRDARKVVWAAASRLEGPQVAALRKTLFKRGLLVVGVLALLVVGAGGVRLARNRGGGPNLLTGKSFRASSRIGHDPGNPKLLFHTAKDASPWVEYDLSARTELREVTLTNRSDCCNEAVLPLVVEVSDDQDRWTRVVGRSEPFTGRLTLNFTPVTARYLRVRVDRPSYLHLEGVEAR